MQAMSEMYNRSIELFCYSTGKYPYIFLKHSFRCIKLYAYFLFRINLEPINIFHGVLKNDNEPIRLSYQRGSHYNSIVDPYKATVGVGLGLPSFNPGSADRELISDAVRQSEELQIEQVNILSYIYLSTKLFFLPSTNSFLFMRFRYTHSSAAILQIYSSENVHP